MGCCGNKGGQKVEYLITYRDGTTETVPDVGTARIKISQSKIGATYRAVARKA